MKFILYWVVQTVIHVSCPPSNVDPVTLQPAYHNWILCTETVTDTVSLEFYTLEDAKSYTGHFDERVKGYWIEERKIVAIDFPITIKRPSEHLFISDEGDFKIIAVDSVKLNEGVLKLPDKKQWP